MRKFFLPIIIGLLWSCSNGVDDIAEQGTTSRTFNVTEANLKIRESNGRLTFGSQAAFDAAVKALEKCEVTTNKPTSKGVEYSAPIAVKEISIKGFQSLSDDFKAAMNEAEAYCDTEAGYKEFKNRHPALFFAEQADDYSAYLPVSNRTVAKLLNAKGEVEIAGKVKDLRDITSYRQLTALRLTLPTGRETRRVNRLDDVKCNGRKLWVTVWTRPGTYPGVLQEIVIEVGFRKKGAFGAWYNYSSETWIGWKDFPAIGHESGYSSHDYLIARIYNNGLPVPLRGKMWVKFRGFGGECGENKYEFDVDI